MFSSRVLRPFDKSEKKVLRSIILSVLSSGEVCHPDEKQKRGTCVFMSIKEISSDHALTLAFCINFSRIVGC